VSPSLLATQMGAPSARRSPRLLIRGKWRLWAAVSIPVLRLLTTGLANDSASEILHGPNVSEVAPLFSSDSHAHVKDRGLVSPRATWA
jgi:hypothetical protein